MFLASKSTANSGGRGSEQKVVKMSESLVFQVEGGQEQFRKDVEAGLIEGISIPSAEGNPAAFWLSAGETGVCCMPSFFTGWVCICPSWSPECHDKQVDIAERAATHYGTELVDIYALLQEYAYKHGKGDNVPELEGPTDKIYSYTV